MTDDKCPLTQMRAEEFIRDRQSTGGVVVISADLLRDFVRESWREGYNYGHEEGYQEGAENKG